MTVLALSRRLPIPAPVTPTMCLIVDKAAFEAWLRAARADSRIEYHRGHLVIDRQQRPDAPDNEVRAALTRGNNVWFAPGRTAAGGPGHERAHLPLAGLRERRPAAHLGMPWALVPAAPGTAGTDMDGLPARPGDRQEAERRIPAGGAGRSGWIEANR